MKPDFSITEIAGIIRFDPKSSSGKAGFAEYNANLKNNELIFHFSGESTVTFGGKILKTQPNTLRFLPKIDGKIYTVDSDVDGECIDIFFSTNAPISDEAFIINADRSRIGTLFEKAFTIWVAKNEGYYFECISLLYKIFAEMEKQTYLPEKQFSQIKPAVDYINNNFTSDISTQTLCELCGISYSYIKRLFIKRYNMPPKKYALSLKINYACELLRSGMYSVSATAEECGYRDLYFFSRQFKEYIGVSPTEFIKRNK